jgi:hypothetical protein
MATKNIYQVTWHHTLGHKAAQDGETSLVAAAAGAQSSTLASLIQSNYVSPNPSAGGPVQDSRPVAIDNINIRYHNVLSTGATGLCTLYRVSWHNSRYNAANTQFNDTLVLAAAGLQAGAFASTIQTDNGDGLTVTVDRAQIELAGVIA